VLLTPSEDTGEDRSGEPVKDSWRRPWLELLGDVPLVAIPEVEARCAAAGRGGGAEINSGDDTECWWVGLGCIEPFVSFEVAAAPPSPFSNGPAPSIGEAPDGGGDDEGRGTC